MVATADDDGVQLHLYAPASVHAELSAGRVGFEVETQYPQHGRVRVRVVESPDEPWTLGLRLPKWADGCTVAVNGVEQPARPVGRTLPLRRHWAVGDEVVLELPMRARRTTPDDRVDSVRGCVAIERGPLVYCFEQLDQDVVLDATAVVPGELVERGRPDLLGGVTTVEVPARDGQTLTAIPYYAWANRDVGPMSVWIDAR
jgi:DUF1680 family protein